MNALKSSPTIWVGKESYMYLNRISRKQRGCKPLTEEAENRMWDRITGYGEQTEKRLDNDSMGGGDGTYYGVWTSWTTEDMKRLLEEGNLSYRNGETIEKIHVCI